MQVLAGQLRDFGLPVPQLYTYDPEGRRFVFEDCGDRSLAMLANGHQDAAVERITDAGGSDWLEHLFGEAIAVVAKLQAITPEASSIAGGRWLEFENLRAEAQEFIDYVAVPRGATKGALEVLRRQGDALCETMRAFPRRVSHFDFHGHNILVRDDGSIVLLDFQDACLASPARDVVSLLNDRGMDEVLGQARHSRLLLKAFQTLGFDSNQFGKYYNLTLLHWDLRVSGRFHKLGLDKKTTRYEQWIPGTLRRLGRTLARSYKEIHGMDDLAQVIESLCPEAKDGMADSWALPILP